MRGLNKRVRVRCAGMTLLELTTAIFVLIVGVFGVLQMFHYGLDTTRAINEANVAVRTLQNEIETLRSLPFAELEDMDGGPFRSLTPEAARLVNIRTRATIAAEPDVPGLKRVTVRIAWTGEHGRTIRKELTTLIAAKTTAPES